MKQPRVKISNGAAASRCDALANTSKVERVASHAAASAICGVLRSKAIMVMAATAWLCWRSFKPKLWSIKRLPCGRRMGLAALPALDCSVAHREGKVPRITAFRMSSDTVAPSWRSPSTPPSFAGSGLPPQISAIPSFLTFAVPTGASERWLATYFLLSRAKDCRGMGTDQARQSAATWQSILRQNLNALKLLHKK